MDDRSRKLLSNQALPKAKLPEPKPHQRREFKLPQGVTPKPVMRATSEGLRAKALEEGVKLAEGSKGNVKLPGMPPAAPENTSAIVALGEVKWPAIGTPPALALVAMQNNKLLCDQCVEIDGIDFARRGGGGVIAGMRAIADQHQRGQFMWAQHGVLLW